MSETSRDARPTRTQEFLARRAEVVAAAVASGAAAAVKEEVIG